MTTAIGRKIKRLIKNEGAVQRFNLNKISLRKYLENNFDFNVNNSKEDLFTPNQLYQIILQHQNYVLQV